MIRKIKDELAEMKKNQPDSLVYGVTSMVFSVLLVLLSFFAIGSSAGEIPLISWGIRAFAMVFGLVVIVLIATMAMLQMQLNKKWIAWLAILCGILAVAFYAVVVYSSVLELGLNL